MTDHVAYLEAKRGVDDRSLSRRALRRAFEPLPDEPRILEVGAGTATMVERLHEWDVLDAGEWIAVDSHAGAIRRGRERLLARADARPLDGAGANAASRSSSDGRSDRGVALGDLEVELVRADAFAHAERAEPASLLVGCAFFDVVDLGRLSAFEPLADRVYAPITYDGTTRFEPADPEDDRVLGTYREHMARCRPGSPDGGEALRAALSAVETAARSPWVIEPPYRAGERVVVEHVLGAIESAVGELGVDASAWAGRRRRQLAADELRYRAENVDVVGRL